MLYYNFWTWNQKAPILEKKFSKFSIIILLDGPSTSSIVNICIKEDNETIISIERAMTKSGIIDSLTFHSVEFTNKNKLKEDNNEVINSGSDFEDSDSNSNSSLLSRNDILDKIGIVDTIPKITIFIINPGLICNAKQNNIDKKEEHHKSNGIIATQNNVIVIILITLLVDLLTSIVILICERMLPELHHLKQMIFEIDK